MTKAVAQPTVGLAIVRLSLGLLLLTKGWSWLGEDGPDPELLRASVEAAVASVNALFAWWGEDVLLSNPAGLAFLLRWTCFLGGISLTFGVLTRPVGTLLAFVFLQAMIYGPEGSGAAFFLPCIVAAASALSGAGRTLGFDASFDKSLPSWLTWSKSKDGLFS